MISGVPEAYPTVPGSPPLVLVKTRDGTSTLTVDQVERFESEFFDGWLECVRPNDDGHLELVLPVNTKVWKRAVACMETKKYSAPPAWSGDDVLTKLLEEQLSYLASRPLTAAIKQAEAAKAVAVAEAAKKILGDFVRIEAGEFTMGSPEGEVGRYERESQCRVGLTQAFWVQATPVTQRQWRSMMESNPSHFHTDGPGDELAADRPVEQINWYEAAAYCNALSVKSGLPPYYELTGSRGSPGTPGYVNPSRVSTLVSGVNSYRLPSAAEQERMRRGSEASTASHATYAPAGMGLGDIAWSSANASSRTHSVGRLLPTNEGVYDALGNVFEWASDWFAGGPVASGASGKLIDSMGFDTSQWRVCSGGSWRSSVGFVRAAFRGGIDPANSGSQIGFRPARFVPPADA